MHRQFTALLVLLLIVNTVTSNVVTASCTAHHQCKVSSRVCKQCDQGKGPRCTIPMCINGHCGEIPPCSLQLGATCDKDHQCLTNHLCETCVANKGPFCTEAICLHKRCAVIGPCSIVLKN